MDRYLRVRGGRGDAKHDDDDDSGGEGQGAVLLRSAVAEVKRRPGFSCNRGGGGEGGQGERGAMEEEGVGGWGVCTVEDYCVAHCSQPVCCAALEVAAAVVAPPRQVQTKVHAVAAPAAGVSVWWHCHANTHAHLWRHCSEPPM